MAPKGPKSEAGRLTLTSVAGNKLRLTMAGDGKGSRNLEFQVDETGALHPASMRELATPPSRQTRPQREPTVGCRTGALASALCSNANRCAPWRHRTPRFQFNSAFLEPAVP